MDRVAAMKALKAVVDNGSFSGAARVLRVPKTTVSQRIRDLEAMLSVRLLHRTTRSVSLTEEGKAYHERCARILEDIEDLENAVGASGARPAGRLTVSCMSSLARAVILPRIASFKAKYPDVSLRLSVTDRLVNVVEDGFDCVVRGGALDDSRLVSRHVLDVAFGVYASPSLVAHGPEPRHPADLLDQPLVMRTSARTGGIEPWALAGEADPIRIEGPAWLETDDDDAVLAGCIAGVGYAVCPDFAAAPHVAAGRLVRVLPRWRAGERPLHIVYPSRLHHAARLRCFIDWATSLLKDEHRHRAGAGLLAEDQSLP